MFLCSFRTFFQKKIDNSCCSLSSCVVFSFGSAEKGQLGNGTTGERITTGNKTAFDIEPSPGESVVFSFLDQPFSLERFGSLRQGAGRKANCPDCVWATT